jgi:hypothetical protein
MWRKRSNALFAVFFCVALSAQTPGAPPREIENVAAFARLYGVVRYFYPGDTAAALDWNRFVVQGVARVRTAGDATALASALRELFSSLGPGIEIAPALAAFRAPAPSTEPLVAWRYIGAGGVDSRPNSPYSAKRTSRARRLAATPNEANTGVVQNFPARDIRGKMIRLRAQVRATAMDPASGAGLMLRVDRENQALGFFDNMGDRLIRNANWREYTIVGNVADDAFGVVFGVVASGATTADVDAMELAVRDADGSWRPLTIKDAGFEAAADASGWGRVGSPNAQHTRLAEDAPEGRQFLRISPPPVTMSTTELFADAPPEIGDHADLDLGVGLHSRVALTLTDSQAKTASTIAGTKVASSDLDARLADVLVAWNAYRHFYPYFADVGVNWDARLQPQLRSVYDATTRQAETDALRRLVADARDGHGRVADLRQRTPPSSFPLQLALLDSRVVVVASRATNVGAGSVIVSIDGVKATDRLAATMELFSGTAQWRQSQAAQEIAFCANGATARLAIENPSGPQTVDVPCATGLAPVETRPKQIAELQPGVWYVDLTSAKTTDLRPVVATLAAGKGIVFDVRGYPTEAGLWLLRHLIDAPENDRWMHIAKVTGPFGHLAGWQDIGWNLMPETPKLNGKIVFLTDGRAISYAESVMGYVHDRHLGTIIGSTTAGTNGDISVFTVPGGFSIIFTGLRVTGHDGRAVHHLVGVKPDIEVLPTIAGLRAGKDEVLERALTYVQNDR